MASIEIRGHDVIVHVALLDKLLSLRSALHVPLAHVRDVHIGMAPVTAQEIGEDFSGTWRPGHLVAGTCTTADREHLIYCDVRHPERALVLELEGDPYARVAVEVEAPDTDAHRIADARERLLSGHHPSA